MRKGKMKGNFQQNSNFYRGICRGWNRLIPRVLPQSKFLLYGPTKINFHVTEKCNLYCEDCLRQSGDKSLIKSTDITTELVKHCLKRFPGVRFAGFAGFGEPLLSDTIFDSAAICKSMGVNTSLITNGVILEESSTKVAQFFTQYISVSMHGLDGSEFNETTGMSAELFKSVLRGVEALNSFSRNRTKDWLRISYVCSKKSIRKAKGLIELAKELKINCVEFHGFIPYVISEETKAECLYDDDREILEVIEELKSLGSGLMMTLPVLLNRHRSTTSHCNWFWNSLIVNGNGDVSGCGRLIPPNKEFGNIWTDNNLWNGRYFRSMRSCFLEQIEIPNCCYYCVETQ